MKYVHREVIHIQDIQDNLFVLVASHKTCSDAVSCSLANLTSTIKTIFKGELVTTTSETEGHLFGVRHLSLWTQYHENVCELKSK